MAEMWCSDQKWSSPNAQNFLMVPVFSMAGAIEYYYTARNHTAVRYFLLNFCVLCDIIARKELARRARIFLSRNCGIFCCNKRKTNENTKFFAGINK